MALKILFQLSTFEFIHRRFNTTSEHIDGMNAIYEAIEEFDFSNSVFPMTQEYANWETDAVKNSNSIQIHTFKHKHSVRKSPKMSHLRLSI